jgi:hypothetical protein
MHKDNNKDKASQKDKVPTQSQPHAPPTPVATPSNEVKSFDLHNNAQPNGIAVATKTEALTKANSVFSSMKSSHSTHSLRSIDIKEIKGLPK